MQFTDDQLLLLIKSGMSDDEIIQYVHKNTKPADLYGAVAEVVTQVLEGDAETLGLIERAESEAVKCFHKNILKISLDETWKEVADWWKDLGITRKDTKVIVMTYLYGSSEYGNRDSIAERIEDRSDEIIKAKLDHYHDRSGSDEWKDQRTLAITVMVRLIRGAMSIVCPSTVETMAWIQTMAEMLGNMDKPLEWVTPLGFTVVQDNPNLETKRVQCYEKGNRVAQLKIKVPAAKGKKLNARKMAAGASPNFVHSFDACHLQLVALHTGTEYFHMIHDSMATQVADTPLMADSLRLTFCMMYEDADRLFDMWMHNNGDELHLPEPKPLGNFDVAEVKKSKYFFH